MRWRATVDPRWEPNERCDPRPAGAQVFADGTGSASFPMGDVLNHRLNPFKGENPQGGQFSCVAERSTVEQRPHELHQLPGPRATSLNVVTGDQAFLTIQLANPAGNDDNVEHDDDHGETDHHNVVDHHDDGQADHHNDVEYDVDEYDVDHGPTDRPRPRRR